MDKSDLVAKGRIIEEECGHGHRLAFVVQRGDTSTICGTLSFNFTRDAHVARIDLWLLTVDPIWRRFGIAKRLMEHVLSHNVLTTLLVDENNHARTLYESYGFTVTHRDEDTGGAPTLYMVRDVTEEDLCRT